MKLLLSLFLIAMLATTGYSAACAGTADTITLASGDTLVGGSAFSNYDEMVDCFNE